MKKVMENVRRFWKDESGMGTLEILLIIAVIVLIAVVFRKWIITWVNSLFESTDTQIRDQFQETESILTPDKASGN